MEAADAKRQRNEGDVVPTPSRPLQPDLSGHMASLAPLLSAAFKRWKEQKALGKRWTAKAKNDYRNWLTLFIEVCGDRPITEYRKADGREFKDVLTKLPANWRKMPEKKTWRPEVGGGEGTVMQPEYHHHRDDQQGAWQAQCVLGMGKQRV